MNKRVLGAVLVLVLLVGGALTAYAAVSPIRSNPAEVAVKPTPGVPSPGVYTKYTKTAIAHAQGRILLFFDASWCPACFYIDKDIRENGVPAGVTIIDVDWDSHYNLLEKYGVSQLDTIVEVDTTGKKLQKFVAYDTPNLAAIMAAMIDN